MQKPEYKDMLEAGCHFGHLRKKWNPKMTPYIFMEHKGIHIIDLNRTAEMLERSALAMKTLAKSGKKIMFVATKKQARDIVKSAAESVGMPFVTERWLGGMMTNFATIRKSVKKMQHIERQLADTTLTSITKKERLTMSREYAKMQKQLGGIEQLNRLPSAVFIVDIHHEHLALAEAKRLNVKTFGMVDTNSDPTLVDFAIPSNDDASKAIAFITNYLTAAIKEGIEERKAVKGDEEAAA
jgi:small subunit ribosomal protein S2